MTRKFAIPPIAVISVLVLQSLFSGGCSTDAGEPRLQGTWVEVERIKASDLEEKTESVFDYVRNFSSDSRPSNDSDHLRLQFLGNRITEISPGGESSHFYKYARERIEIYSLIGILFSNQRITYNVLRLDESYLGIIVPGTDYELIMFRREV